MKIIGCPDLCLCIRGCTLLPLSSVICTCTAVLEKEGSADKIRREMHQLESGGLEWSRQRR